MNEQQQQQQPTPKEQHLIQMIENLKAEIGQAAAARADLVVTLQNMKAHAENLEKKVAEYEAKEKGHDAD